MEITDYSHSPLIIDNLHPNLCSFAEQCAFISTSSRFHFDKICSIHLATEALTGGHSCIGGFAGLLCRVHGQGQGPYIHLLPGLQNNGPTSRLFLHLVWSLGTVAISKPGTRCLRLRQTPLPRTDLLRSLGPSKPSGMRRSQIPSLDAIKSSG